MILSTTIIEDIRLDFAVWLAKRARKFRCDEQDIVAALQESHHVTATHPAADVAPTSSAGTEGDEDRHQSLPGAVDQWRGTAGVAIGESPVTTSIASVIEPMEAGGANAGGENVAEQVILSSIAEHQEPVVGALVVAADVRQPSPDEIARIEGESNGSAVALPIRPKAQKRVTTADKIKAIQAEHPEWTARQIADEIGADQKHINAAAKAAGITIHRLTAAQVIERRREGGQLGASASPVRAKAPLPVAPPSTVLGTAGADETYRTIKKPKGQRFRLRTGNGTGKYLHMSCIGLVPGTDYAWTGTEAQMVAVRSKFPETLDMREEPVT